MLHVFKVFFSTKLKYHYKQAELNKNTCVYNKRKNLKERIFSKIRSTK